MPQFTGVQTAQQLRVDAGVQQEVAALRGDIAALRSDNVVAREALRAARAANAQLGGQLTCALAERDQALVKEGIARKIFLTQKGQEKTMDKWARAVALEEENTILKQHLQDARSQRADTDKELQGISKDLEKTVRELESTKTKLEELQSANEQLKKDLSHEKQATAHHEAALTSLYADLEQSRNTCKAANKARDDALVQQKDRELQFDELRTQWEEDQSKITELEERLEDFRRLDAEHAGLQEDLDTLREHLADNERTLMVKDERIAHLETQYQKERQRNLNAAHADDLAARTTSPTEELPQTLNTLADSLEDDLGSDYDDYIQGSEESFNEPLEESDIYEVANFAPIHPTPAPASAIHVYNIASVEPVAAAVPRLTVNVNEAASVAPVEAAPSSLTVDLDTAADVAPITPAIPQLTLHVGTAASVAPVDATVPQLTLSIDTAASVAPEEVTLPHLSLNMVTATSVTPIEAIAPAHTTSIATAASVTPIERQITTSHTSTQTDTNKLTTEILFHATRETTPVEPSEVKCNPPSIPKLSTHMVDNATMTITPVEKVEVEHKHTTDDAVELPTMLPLAPSKATSPLSWIAYMLLAALSVLFAYCWNLKQELYTWEHANGVGIYHQYGTMYDRVLFGWIPVALDSGWLAQAIITFEDLFGLASPPLY
jgi:predicted  nucleic acid-binding Zn-ribbon protein